MIPIFAALAVFLPTAPMASYTTLPYPRLQSFIIPVGELRAQEGIGPRFQLQEEDSLSDSLLTPIIWILAAGAILKIGDHIVRAASKSSTPEQLRRSIDPPITHSDVSDIVDVQVDIKDTSHEPDDTVPHERIIVVTGSFASDSDCKPIEKFKSNTNYRLKVRVAEPIAKANLVLGTVGVPDQPVGGLLSRWIVSSKTVEFLSIAPNGIITKRGDANFAEFDMLIPEIGDSPTIDLLVRTNAVPSILEITVLAFGEEYRKAVVRLDSDGQTTSDVISTKPEHLNLRTTHEWTTPWEHFKLTVFGQKVYVSTVGLVREDPGWFDWSANKSKLDGPIKRVRRTLDAYRVAAGALLDELDFEDIRSRLQSCAWMDYPSKWHLADDPANGPIGSSCGDLEELRLLADAGYSLFDSCFPADSDLRKFIEGLKPGSRLDFVWTGSGGDWVSHVPWALMYMAPIPPGALADCGRFFGLRFRIEGKAWEPQAPSAALGNPDDVNALHFLYWGDNSTDIVGRQSAWQRETFGKWDRQFFVPAVAAPDKKEQVKMALATPSPAPTGIIYLYCECVVGDGSEPDLQFSDDPTKSNILTAGEIYQGPLEGNPLVFINACMSSKSEPQGASELEQRFFRRNIRAFLGTEEKVPAVFASRFAWLFFQFFLRKADPVHAPMAAGEALTQARLFLWTQYQNPGGLFYCLVNRYDLFFADDAEVAALQRRK